MCATSDTGIAHPTTLQFGGKPSAKPKKAAKKVAKKAAKKVVKKAAKKVAKKVIKKSKPTGDVSFLQKLFSLSLVGGAQGVDLADDYKL